MDEAVSSMTSCNNGDVDGGRQVDVRPSRSTFVSTRLMGSVTTWPLPAERGSVSVVVGERLLRTGSIIYINLRWQSHGAWFSIGGRWRKATAYLYW